MNQGDLFNAEESQRRKEEGMARGAAARMSPLLLGRKIARDYCRQHKEVTADDVGKILLAIHGITTLGPAAGSLFRGGEFVATGQMRAAVKTSSNGRLIRVWRLANASDAI